MNDDNINNGMNPTGADRVELEASASTVGYVEKSMSSWRKNIKPLIIAGLVWALLSPLVYMGCFDGCQWDVWLLIIPSTLIWIAMIPNILMLLFYILVFVSVSLVGIKKERTLPILILFILCTILPLFFFPYQKQYSTSVNSPLLNAYFGAGLELLLYFVAPALGVLWAPFIIKLPYWLAILVGYPFYLLEVAFAFWLAGLTFGVSGGHFGRHSYPKIFKYLGITLVTIVLVAGLTNLIIGSSIEDDVYNKTFNVSSYQDCYKIPKDLVRPLGKFPDGLHSYLKFEPSYDYELTNSVRNSCFMWQAIKSQKPELCIFEDSIQYFGNCIKLYLHKYYNPVLCDLNREIFKRRVQEEYIPAHTKYMKKTYNFDYVPSGSEVETFYEDCTRERDAITKTIKQLNEGEQHRREYYER